LRGHNSDNEGAFPASAAALSTKSAKKLKCMSTKDPHHWAAVLEQAIADAAGDDIEGKLVSEAERCDAMAFLFAANREAELVQICRRARRNVLAVREAARRTIMASQYAVTD
jgi:hypothetical protein